jgi:hypothetical protein
VYRTEQHVLRAKNVAGSVHEGTHPTEDVSMSIKGSGSVPFFAQFMQPTAGTDPSPPMTTRKAGLKGNDVDSDGDVGVAPGAPVYTTMKAGLKGNDADSDGDVGVAPGEPVYTTMKAGLKGNDVDSDGDVGVSNKTPIYTTLKAGLKGNDIDGDTDVGVAPAGPKLAPWEARMPASTAAGIEARAQLPSGKEPRLMNNRKDGFAAIAAEVALKGE